MPDDFFFNFHSQILAILLRSQVVLNSTGTCSIGAAPPWKRFVRHSSTFPVVGSPTTPTACENNTQRYISIYTVPKACNLIDQCLMN